MKHITVFRDPGVYASHASVCQAANGDILVAYRQAPFEHVFAHVHPDSSVGISRSRDMGETWDAAGTVLEPGPETNINDPSLTTLSDGTILLTAFTLPCPHRADGWGDRALPVRGNTYHYVPGEQRIIISRSRDNGHTWEGPYSVDVSFYGSRGAGVFGTVVEMNDGRLLMPITAHSPESDTSTAALLCSRDGGLTWGPGIAITTWRTEENAARSFSLPSVVAYDDRTMLATGWCVAESGTLICRTEDGGRTWSNPERLNTRGACMHLCLTRSGATVMSYGYRHPPYGIRVLPSYDQGRTWDTERVCELRADGAMRDLGYPWSIQLSDGRLMCVYYFNEHDADKSYYDEAASRAICEQWNLEPELYTYKTAGLRFIGATVFEESELAGLAESRRTASDSAKEEPTLM